MRVFQNAKKRPVYVNGVYCESLAAGAREASRILGVEVHLWQIQRAVNGEKMIIGLDISEISPKQEMRKETQEETIRGKPLLRYPSGESCLERGLPRQWR